MAASSSKRKCNCRPGRQAVWKPRSVVEKRPRPVRRPTSASPSPTGPTEILINAVFVPINRSLSNSYRIGGSLDPSAGTRRKGDELHAEPAEQVSADPELISKARELFSYDRGLISAARELESDQDELISKGEELFSSDRGLFSNAVELISSAGELNSHDPELFSKGRELISSSGKLSSERRPLFSIAHELFSSKEVSFQIHRTALGAQARELGQDLVRFCVKDKSFRRPKPRIQLLGVLVILIGWMFRDGSWSFILSPMRLDPDHRDRRSTVWVAPPCPCLPRPPPPC